MLRKILTLGAASFFVLASGSTALNATPDQKHKGVLSIYFNNEKVGYEEFTWEPDDWGYTLKVKGKMIKPVPVEIKKLTVCVDKSYIPSLYKFKGSISGVQMEISSTITEGRVKNIKHIAGQRIEENLQIQRDAFLLPNPVFSPYMVITKKYHCILEEPTELSAYIIPQMETPFILGTSENAPCSLTMQLSSALIELGTDESGTLKSLSIPSQKMKITLDS